MMHTDIRHHPWSTILRIVALVILVFVWAGCAGRSLPVAKGTGGWSAGEKKSEAVKTQESEQRTGGSEDRPDSGKPASSNKAQRPSDARFTASGAKSEQERVRIVAEGLAKRTPKVAYMRICHDEKRDEWWITLYQDAGFRLELKQFIWNKAQDKAEAFTVLRYVSRTDLAAHLAESTPEKPCKAFKATENGWTVAGPEPPQAR